MSVSENHGRLRAWAFMLDRVKRDLQFSNIFLVDFTVSMAYAVATVAFLAHIDASRIDLVAVGACVIAYASLHIAKILLIVHLERQGGDAREFVGSDQLVTSGVYAWSRNPVYLISMFQSAIWSLGLICMTAGAPDIWLAVGVAALLLYAHYWGQDRLIIPNEEAALLARHPQDFPAYCAQVKRWFGRNRNAQR